MIFSCWGLIFSCCSFSFLGCGGVVRSFVLMSFFFGIFGIFLAGRIFWICGRGWGCVLNKPLIMSMSASMFFCGSGENFLEAGCGGTGILGISFFVESFIASFLDFSTGVIFCICGKGSGNCFFPGEGSGNGIAF